MTITLDKQHKMYDIHPFKLLDIHLDKDVD